MANILIDVPDELLKRIDEVAAARQQAKADRPRNGLSPSQQQAAQRELELRGKEAAVAMIARLKAENAGLPRPSRVAVIVDLLEIAVVLTDPK